MANDNALVVVNMHENATDIVLADQNCNISYQETYELEISNLDEESLQWEIGGMIAKTFGLEKKQRSSASVAISFPGIIEPISGKIIDCPLNQKLNKHSITGELKKNINCPIGIENNVNNALIGENWQGVAKNIHSALYFDLLESFSADLLVDGQIIYGANFNAGNLSTAEKLKNAQELFATSTAGGIMPITKINGELISNGKIGTITRKLHKLYWEKHSDPLWSTSIEDILK